MLAHEPKTTRAKPSPGKRLDAQEAFVRLLTECSQSGYYGSVSLTLNVQDGHIQHVRIATDRLVR